MNRDHDRLNQVWSAGILLLASGAAAAALPECTAAALQAAAPPGMTIQDVPNVVSGHVGSAAAQFKTTGGVVYVAADTLAAGAPEYCYVTGTVVTNPKSGKTANFAAALPGKAHWNGRFMFQGCGGNCGVINPPTVSTLRRGYPVWQTDDGHVAKPSPEPGRLWRASDTSWAISKPGKRDEDAMTDFYHRAVHKVAAAGKQFTLAHYGADRFKYSYFQGCSDGGREGMVALSRYPQDFDGMIVGAPYFDIANEIVTTLVGLHAQLRSPRAAVPAELFRAADRIVTAQCDALDGATDGLIHDPGQCPFDPNRDLPRCSQQDSADAQCFSDDQIDSLSIMFSGITDPAGKVIYPGFSISDLYDHEDSVMRGNLLSHWLSFPVPPSSLQGPQPWSHDLAGQPLGWYWVNQTIANFVYDGASDFNALKTPGITFTRDKTGRMHAVIPRKTVALLNEKVKDGSGATPSEAAAYIKLGRKLIMYHGYSDGPITPYRTIQYYRELAEQHGGYAALKRDARLFMVPGLAHCRGGPGANAFGQPSLNAPTKVDSQHDLLMALEHWVEQDRAPERLIASKFERDDVTKPIVRTLPLCPFPAMARYAGAGDINDAANWSCPADDRRLELRGPAGERGGLYAPLPK
jgi:hypothetical protein